MTFAAHVKGGTGAGRKVQKPAPKHWQCGCTAPVAAKHGLDARLVQPGYMSRCTDCGQQRPNG